MRGILRTAFAVVLAGFVSGCASGGMHTGSTDDGGPSSSGSAIPTAGATSAPTASATAIRLLGDLSAKELCGLVPREKLTDAAFPVRAGDPIEYRKGRGRLPMCAFTESPLPGPGEMPGTVAIAAMPENTARRLGTPNIEVAGVEGVQDLRNRRCVVYLPVKEATLQVIVTMRGERQCAIAKEVAALALAKLAH